MMGEQPTRTENSYSYGQGQVWGGLGSEFIAVRAGVFAFWQLRAGRLRPPGLRLFPCAEDRDPGYGQRAHTRSDPPAAGG
jgi:hypothetical protein